jgi:hypothetical protein
MPGQTPQPEYPSMGVCLTGDDKTLGWPAIFRLMTADSLCLPNHHPDCNNWAITAAPFKFLLNYPTLGLPVAASPRGAFLVKLALLWHVVACRCWDLNVGCVASAWRLDVISITSADSSRQVELP